jgi:ABC-type multidrug transport system permease subunit
MSKFMRRSEYHNYNIVLSYNKIILLFLCFCFVLFFETGFLCIALAVLELTL